MLTTILLLALHPSALFPARAESLAELEMRPVELELKGGETATAYRGTLWVPIVRADPDSKRIGVDVWRFPAADGVPAERLPIFQLHGGPGWPGMEPRDVDWSGDVAPLIAHGDLVVVGQRGIGTSQPNTDCSEHAVQIDPELSAEEQQAMLEDQLGACRNAWEAEDYDLTGFNVIEAAGDVDDVRRLLGYEQVVIYGGSFGSHWGMTVMRYYPDAVARAVLHGMEGPDHTYDNPGGLLEALERVAAEAEAYPAFEGRLPEQGLIEAFRGVIRAVEEHPLEERINGRSVRIDADDLREAAMGYSSSVGSRNGVAGWPRDVMRLVEGNFGSLARSLDSQRQSGRGGLPSASFFLLDCGSGITAERHERYVNDPAVELLGFSSEFYDQACPTWEVDLGDDFRADFRTPIPTLMVHGTWDVSTPYSNAVELVPCFGELHFVTVEGGTHGAIFEAMRHDPSFEAAVMAFLATGAVDDLPSSVQLPPIEWVTSW